MIEAYNKDVEMTGVTAGLPQIPALDEDDLADLRRKCPSVSLREGSAWLHFFLGGQCLCRYRGGSPKTSQGPLSLHSGVGKIPRLRLGWNTNLNVYGTPPLRPTERYSPLKLPRQAHAVHGPSRLSNTAAEVFHRSASDTGWDASTISKPLLATLERLYYLPSCVLNSPPLDMPSSSSTEPEQRSTRHVQYIIKAFHKLFEYAKTNQKSTQSIQHIDNDKFGELVQELKGRERLRVITDAHREQGKPTPTTTTKSLLQRLANLATAKAEHLEALEVFRSAFHAQCTQGENVENKHSSLLKLPVSLANAG
jgi:hypothetical protein